LYNKHSFTYKNRLTSKNSMCIAATLLSLLSLRMLRLRAA